MPFAVAAERPKEATVPPGAETFWRAWHALRYDRQYGAFGGETPINFVSIDAYARRYGIAGAEWEIFHALIGEIDREYLAWVEENRPKPPGPSED